MNQKSKKKFAFLVLAAAVIAPGLFAFGTAHADDATTTATTTPTVATTTQTTAATSTTATSTDSSGTNATTTPALVDPCAPSAADLAKLTAVRNDPTLSYSDELKAELAVRKELLSETITCAQTEASNLQASLSALTVTGDAANLSTELSGKLNDAVNFYSIELNKLNTVGIAGSQAIAREVLAYRTGSYDPLAGDANNFIIWEGNQNLFATAQTRMDQTSRAVSFLESATPNNDLQDAMTSARSKFQNAQSENQAALQALIQFQPPDQSLAIIQESLSSLSDTYQQFFNVSTIIQTLLPQ